MSVKRKSYSADFKAKLVLEVLEGEKTINEIASSYEVLPASLKQRKALVDTKLNISLNMQCQLLQVNKSSLYYKPTKPFSSGNDLKVLDDINNIYSDFPSYGYRRIHKQLIRDGYDVGKKFVKKAMKYT